MGNQGLNWTLRPVGAKSSPRMNLACKDLRPRFRIARASDFQSFSRGETARQLDRRTAGQQDSRSAASEVRCSVLYSEP